MLAFRLILTGLVSALALAWPAAVLAHPLDELGQSLYLTLTPSGLRLEIHLSPGVLIAPDVIAAIDADRDGGISEPEATAYGRRVLTEVDVSVDGRTYRLELASVDVPAMLNLVAGVGTMRIQSAPLALPGASERTVEVVNRYAPVRSAYQSAVVVEPVTAISVAEQARDETLQTLRVRYSVVLVPGSGAGQPAESRAAAPNGPFSDQQRLVLETLADPGPPWWLLGGAMVLSAVLGAFHALTPGHGKALLASYLVGSRGTVGHALALGGSVTVTHTASVIATGVVVLVAGNLFMPTVLVPALELLAGGLVVLLGLRLLLSRWRGLVTASQSHDHGPGSHAHDHGDHDHPHSHAPQTDPLGDRVRWRDVAVMGFTGGILPCPEAIGILLVAIGLNRVALGLGLITAFSVGLALVLCTLGILLIRSRGLLDRAGLVASPLQRYLPFASAVVVTLFGSVMAFKGISAMLT